MPRGNKNLRGVTGNRGGGMLPAAFAIRARYLLEKANAMDVAAAVIEGTETEERATAKGGIIALKPQISDRLAAARFLAEMGKLMIHQTEDVTPPERKAAPVIAILAALGDPKAMKLLGQDPETGARVRMLQAIEVESEVVD